MTVDTVRDGKVKITCILRGVSPMMQDHMDIKDIEDVLIRKKRAPVVTDMSLEDMAAKKLYKSDEGKVGFPAICLFAAMKTAGRDVKVGRKAVSTATTTTLPSFLSIEEEFLEFAPGTTWKPDVRRGNMHNGAKSTTVGIVRPKFDVWETTVTFLVDLDQDSITVQTVRSLVEVAGAKAGIGSFRPSCNGQFGRFEITGWNVEKVGKN